MHEISICAAIARRQPLSFLYGGRLRSVEPHALGYDRAGDLILRAWQQTGSGPQGWYDYRVGEMRDLTCGMPASFAVRRDFRPSGLKLERTLCRC